MKSRKDKRPDHTQDDRKRNDALNKSPKSAQEKQLPGEYPAKDDITSRLNTKRVGMDVENFSRTVGPENLNINEPVVTKPNSIGSAPELPEDDVEDERDNSSMEHPVAKNVDDDKAERSESDVNEEDLEALGPKDLSMDMGEDEELLKHRTWPVDMAGKDLDIPGSEGAGDTEDQGIGPRDEENDFYSLGGDRHEDNLEGK